MSKDKLLIIVENLLTDFKSNDDTTIVEGFPGCLTLWVRQDNSYVIPFLEKHKVVKMTEGKRIMGGQRGRRKDAIVDKKNLLKFKKFVEEHTDRLIKVGKRIIYGKGKYARRSRVR